MWCIQELFGDGTEPGCQTGQPIDTMPLKHAEPCDSHGIEYRDREAGGQSEVCCKEDRVGENVLGIFWVLDKCDIREKRVGRGIFIPVALCEEVKDVAKGSRRMLAYDVCLGMIVL